MTEPEARASLQTILGELCVAAGDTVYLGVDMARVPLPSYPSALTRDAIRARQELWCEFLYSVLRSVVGAAGTLLVPTFSYAYARDGVPYVHETSPSETGPFTEFLRTQIGAVRSFHPLNSISGIGPAAGAILENVGRAGYGAESPFARLRTHRTKFLFLGAPMGIALTHAHHLEHMYGVNHMYHKVYTRPAYRTGAEDAGPWLCFVRYLGAAIEPRIANLEEAMRTRGMLRESRSGGGAMQCATAEDVETIGYQMLRADPCAFLAEPVEVHVDAPGAAEQSPRARAVRMVIR